MSISYEGIGQWAATFACDGVSAGQVVKVSGNGTVGVNLGAWRLRADWQTDYQHSKSNDDDVINGDDTKAFFQEHGNKALRPACRRHSQSHN